MEQSLKANSDIEIEGLAEPKTHPKFKFEHLVLRDHFFSLYEIDNLTNFECKLQFLEAHLLAHFTIKAARKLNDKSKLNQEKPELV